jgi:hypothetical protein
MTALIGLFTGPAGRIKAMNGLAAANDGTMKAKHGTI